MMKLRQKNDLPKGFENQEVLSTLIAHRPDRNEDDLDNEKLTELMRCLICLNVPIYPKEC